MLKKIALLIFALAFLSTQALGQVDPPKLDPVPSTEKQSALIKEGVALHDQGKYDAAISKYEEVLKENPANVEALYELSFAYSMKKDYRKSLDIASKGAQYKSKLLPALYIQIGNNLDDLGESKKSVEVYKAGIKLSPQTAMLYYNLAVAYSNLSKPDDARKALKQAIAYNPNHPSSHLFLSTIWREGGYKIPALLAASRFLVLEPGSRRSAAALKIVQEVMGGSATVGSNPNQINIFVDMNAKKDEGDFGALDLVLGLGKAVGMTEENKNKTEMQLLVEQFSTTFAIMSEQSDKGDKNKFTWKHYVPYFSEMRQKNYVEPFVYYVHQSSGNEETQKWLANNKARVNEFLAWSKGYAWPKAD
ncbi:MAG TPA: tetratricopeptide repeat protein [Pyrinomonadaceae bacterium]